jgi:hypothetical protein
MICVLETLDNNERDFLLQQAKAEGFKPSERYQNPDLEALQAETEACEAELVELNDKLAQATDFDERFELKEAISDLRATICANRELIENAVVQTDDEWLLQSYVENRIYCQPSVYHAPEFIASYNEGCAVGSDTKQEIDSLHAANLKSIAMHGKPLEQYASKLGHLRGQWTKWEHDNLRSVPLENWEYRPPIGDDGPKAETDTMLRPISLTSLVKQYPAMRDPIIHGVLRSGETMNIIAQPKRGKSFLAGNLAFCVATGTPWLGLSVKQGRVLVIDAELHPETLAERLDRIGNAMMVPLADRDAIEVVSLRGQNCDIHAVGARLAIEPGRYSLIVIDALYRFLPAGTSENDNAQMMAIYNRLDQYAKQYGCAIVVVHHTSKGGQNDKSVVDVGSGAGAIARATDSHVVIRDHETEGLQVMEFATRSFVTPEPVTVKFEHPLWDAIATDAVLRGSRTRREEVQRADDLEADQLLEDAIRDDWHTPSQIVRLTGMGPTRVDRAIGRAFEAQRIDRKRVRKNGKRVEIYRVKPEIATRRGGAE